jgi:bifunctional polynucleotide phosphatase/kinase
MSSIIYKFTEKNDKIASFDLDSTLIKTKSGKVFSKTPDDYEYQFDNVKKKLEQLIKDGYKIVIFTNQKGISLGKVNINDIINKIEDLFPFADYFLSIKDDLYRKPMIGLYDKFIELNGKTKEMFYVGDAAGRNNDHSHSDINFAYNAGIKFYTENEFFLGVEDNVKPHCPELPKKTNKITDFKQLNNNVLVIMQGFPASGKTRFVKEYIKQFKLRDEEYLHLSNDIQGSKAKIMKEFKLGLIDDKLIFIDNSNATKKNREEFIKLAKKEEYTIIGIHIITNEIISRSLNNQRYYISNMDKNYKDRVYNKIPNVVYNVYKKKYEKMDNSEGFYKIYQYMPENKLKYYFV